LHNIGEVKFLSESRDNFGFVLIKQSVQNETSFLLSGIDDFAAMFADAKVFTVNEFMSNTSRFIASRANKLNFADIQWHFLSDDTALRSLEGRLSVAFDFINVFNDDLSLFLEEPE
jgi:hypothetical protein